MDAAVAPLLSALDSDVNGTLVRVTSLRGFGLRDAGDGGVIVDGTIQGSILGGLADTAIVEAASEHPGRHAFRTTITDRAADAAGMVCGGAAQLLLSPVADLPAGLASLLRSAQPLAIVTAKDGSTGDLVATKREVLGDLGDHTDQLLEVARAQIAAGATANVEHDVDGTLYAVSTIIPTPRCAIVGSGAMAEAIQAQGDLLGWDITIDESVPQVTEFLRTAGPADAVIILSHDAAVDVPVLDAALTSSIGYIGGMGSRGTQTRRRTSLLDAGHSAESLERIHGPIGLDLGSRTPAETSVAIVAEYLAHRSGRAPGRLTDSAGPING